MPFQDAIAHGLRKYFPYVAVSHDSLYSWSFSEHEVLKLCLSEAKVNQPLKRSGSRLLYILMNIILTLSTDFIIAFSLNKELVLEL